MCYPSSRIKMGEFPHLCYISGLFYHKIRLLVKGDFGVTGYEPGFFMPIS